MTYNEEINNILIDRAILLERLKSGFAKDTRAIYMSILDDINKSLNSYDEINTTNINKILRDLRDLIDPNIGLVTDFQELAQNEAIYLQTAFNTAASVEIFKKLPSESQLKKIANADLFNGLTMKEAFGQIDENLKLDITSQVRLGVQQSETLSQIKKRLKDLFIGKTSNNINAVVRTAVATVVNQARDEFYRENEDVIKSLMWVATMDGRVRLEHAQRNQKQWSFTTKKPIGHDFPFQQVPYGVACRCILIPITKSYKELGFEDTNEIPPKTRSSMDGNIPADTSFESWLNSKSPKFIEDYLGKGKYELYKKGAITFSDLVTQQGRPISLKILKEKYS